MREYATVNTAYSISNDNHSDLKRTSSIMISKSYRKCTTFPTGDYSVFFMEDSFSVTKIRLTKLQGNVKSAVIDFTQGAKVAGLSACPDFVTNGEHAHSPFTKNVPN